MAPVPPITPYLTVADAAGAVEFYKKALGATVDGEAHRMPGSDKIMHVRLIIAGGLIMLADDFSDSMGGPCMTPPKLGGSPVVLALQVEDARMFWDKAVAGGATVTMPLADMFWGDRYGQFTDPYGHRWSVSQTLKVMSDEEMRGSAQAALEEKGTLMGEVAP